MSDVDLAKPVEMLVDNWYKNITSRPTKWSTQIRDLGDKDYHLREPIMIIIEEYVHEEVVNARWPEIEAFGEGQTEVEAIANLKLAILDLYDELIEIPLEKLGKLPQGWLRVLQQLIVKVEQIHEMA